jgi:DNA-binding LytR/AlgR family response regulator
MLKARVHLVDSNKNNLDLLEKSLTLFGYTITGVSMSKEEAMCRICEHQPDVVITDINLRGGYDGIQFAKEIRNTFSDELEIIYLTNDTAKDAYLSAKEAEPAAYLIKPLSIYNVSFAIEMAIRGTKKYSQKYGGAYLHDILFVKKMHKIIQVPLNAILYVVVESNYSTLETKLGKFTLKLSLNLLMQRLPKNIFIRIHRNYLVNVNQIIEYDFSEYTARLPNKSLPIGRRYKKVICTYLVPLS